MTATVLLITTDATIERLIRRAGDPLEISLLIGSDPESSPEAPEGEPPALVICRSEHFSTVRERWPGVGVVLQAESADSDDAIEAIKRGAIDVFARPVDVRVLRRQLSEALRVAHDLKVPAVYERSERIVGVDHIVGQSPAMKEVYKLIGLIAPRDINVLITGESGTGKELVARAILHHSPRSGQPFLAVNCAAIPDTLLESELFGHEKGAFTGAEARRVGKFEQCDGGTLFLDEIGDIPLSTQAKLLRVLQDRSFQRLGGTDTVHTDVRIIAATHQPLEQLIESKRFRQDLYYRIKVASIHLPALREREVDVVLLAHHFVERYNREFGTEIAGFAPETLPVLLGYGWPGNVRELENAVKAALVVARGSVFRPEFLPEAVRTAATSTEDAPSPPSAPEATSGSIRDAVAALFEHPSAEGRIHERAIEAVERELIRAALERTGGRLATAARLLGMSRTTIRTKIERYGIRVSTIAD